MDRSSHSVFTTKICTFYINKHKFQTKSKNFAKIKEMPLPGARVFSNSTVSDGSSKLQRLALQLVAATDVFHPLQVLRSSSCDWTK